MQLTVTIRNGILSQIATAGGSGGTLVIYAGNPTGVGNAAPSTILATLTGVTYGTPSNGQLSLSATAANGVGSGTPGTVRLLTSGGSAIGEFTAGIGTPATAGTVSITAGAITGIAVGTAGTGYIAGTYSLPCLVTGTVGNDAVVVANFSGGVLSSFSVVSGGFNYSSGTPPTIVVPPPFDFTFNTTVSTGLVSLTSGTFTSGNP